MAEQKNPKSENQKIKLLKLYLLLQEKTDEENPLTTEELLKELDAMGISCDRRTLSKDMQCLNDNGFEVMDTNIGHNKAYYVLDRKLEDAELKVLIDAVQAASFIPKAKTEELVSKIASISSENKAEILKLNEPNLNPFKHSNTGIIIKIELLKNAIYEGKRIQFRYFDLNWKGEKSYHDGGAFRSVEPLALVFRDENYYLVTYNEKKKSDTESDFRNYRVDRIDDLKVEKKKISQVAAAKKNSKKLNEHVSTSFSMFAGKTQEITLKFTGNLAKAVFDKFGEDLKISMLDISMPNVYTARVNVTVSNPFFGWVDQFNGDLTIHKPKEVKEAYREHVKKLISALDDE